jgi:hypothetical protein
MRFECVQPSCRHLSPLRNKPVLATFEHRRGAASVCGMAVGNWTIRFQRKALKASKAF